MIKQVATSHAYLNTLYLGGRETDIFFSYIDLYITTQIIIFYSINLTIENRPTTIT